MKIITLEQFKKAVKKAILKKPKSYSYKMPRLASSCCYTNPKSRTHCIIGAALKELKLPVPTPSNKLKSFNEEPIYNLIGEYEITGIAKFDWKAKTLATRLQEKQDDAACDHISLPWHNLLPEIDRYEAL